MKGISPAIKNAIDLALKYRTISRVGVFGSYAMGTQNGTSDLDILFDYTEPLEDDADYVLDILDYGDELSAALGELNLTMDFVSYRGVATSENKQIRENILDGVVWLYHRKD